MTAGEPLQTVTHGRHCPCSACAREDWTRPDLAACGMHGPDCPPAYAPGEPLQTVIDRDRAFWRVSGPGLADYAREVGMPGVGNCIDALLAENTRLAAAARTLTDALEDFAEHGLRLADWPSQPLVRPDPDEYHKAVGAHLASLDKLVRARARAALDAVADNRTSG